VKKEYFDKLRGIVVPAVTKEELAYARELREKKNRELAGSLLKAGGTFFERIFRPGVGWLDDAWLPTPQLVVDEGMVQILGAAAPGASQTKNANWYGFFYSNSYTPQSTDTAAQIGGNFTEFVNYDETLRQTWTINGDPTTPSISNSSSPMAITISTGGGTIAGYGLITVSTKSAATGTMICATKRAATKTVDAADIVYLQYDLTAASS